MFYIAFRVDLIFDVISKDRGSFEAKQCSLDPQQLLDMHICKSNELVEKKGQ